MEPTPLTLTERIVYLKKCAGSLRRLDKAAGLRPGYCHALVKRIDDPHLSTLHKIADGADVPRSWVTNGDGPLPPAEGIRSAVAAACAGAPDEDDEDDADEAAPALDAPTIDPPRVIEPGPDPYAAAKAKLAVEDAKRTETIVKAMLARKAESEAAEAAKRRVA